MRIQQFEYQPGEGWKDLQENAADFQPAVVLAFGSGKDCSGDIIVQWWQDRFPEADLIGCSTAGEILGTNVTTNTIVVTAIEFAQTSTKLHAVDFDPQEDSFQVGCRVAEQLKQPDLKWVFVLSDGIHVNGTRLVDGMVSCVGEDVVITGGLAGDGKRFQQTQVCANADFGENKVVALAFYGENLKVGYGSLGGWDAFGPDREVTKSDGNVLLELDGQSALSLYKEYLGDHARELPSSGLLFPLKITTVEGKEFVRTLLAIDDDQNSMTFAGDIPEGASASLMKANFDRLVDGAMGAAEKTSTMLNQPDLGILISCVGRKMVLEQRIEEETEAVREVLGDQVALTGFYSYGEICPVLEDVGCTLHNQTMTITTISEVET